MMENWLRSGIDKDFLQKKYNDFLKVGFPTAPEEDDVYDLFADLVELDGHIAGLVSSYLKGVNINFKLLDSDEEFNSILSSIQTKSKSLESLVERKRNLDELIMMIKLIEGLPT